MAHFGIIFCGWGCKEYLNDSLSPWIAARRDGVAGHKASIYAVSVRFAGFEGEDDGTRELLRGYLERGEIDGLIDGPDGVTEIEARGKALERLRGMGVDYIWQVDSDEFYQPAEIERITQYILSDTWTAWWRLSLRNYVFDEKTYLAEPFCPPRIHKMSIRGYRIHSFIADNDVAYGGMITRDVIPQEGFPSVTISDNVAAIKHMSWPNSIRSKTKIDYQLRGRGWLSCTFAWDDSKGGLIFNPNLPAPKVIREEDHFGIQS